LSPDKATVQRAIPLIANSHLDDFTIQSPFFDLNGDLYASTKMDADVFPNLRGHIRLAAEDFLNMVACAHKVEWESDQLVRKGRGMTMWSTFAALDIEAAILFLRALLDDLAGAIERGCPGKGRHFSSFHQLHSFVTEQPAESDKYLGSALYGPVAQCAWFDELRGWRDGIVHQGAQSYVFLADKRVTFQILHSHDILVQHPSLMSSDVAVYFDRFLALYFARTICLLDDVALAIRSNLGIERLEFKPSQTHGGLGYILNWLKELDQHLP